MLTSSRILLLTRSDCPLCVEAETVIQRICDETGATWHKVDVDGEVALYNAWSDHVPVTFVDGELHGRWFVDSDRLRQDLLYGDERPMPNSWRPTSSAST